MFYRPGGSASRINAQEDMVYADFIGGATGWLPVNKGNMVAINIARASIVFQSSAQSLVTMSPITPEVQVLLEMKQPGGVFPIDQWQNLVVATARRAHGPGWWRLRILNINNGDGTGVALSMAVSRSGDPGAAI